MTATFTTLTNGLWLVIIRKDGKVIDQLTAKTFKAAEYKALERIGLL